MNALLQSALRKLSYLAAGVVILAAVLVVTSRLLTPVLDKHKPELEQWASELLQTPVKINEARLSWFQYQLGVSLNQVTILNKESSEPILQIQKVRVFFSIPKSIWQRKLVPSGIMIAGTDLSVYQNAAGEFSVKGFPSLGGFNDKPFDQETKFADMLGWLSLQPRLILRDVDVRFVGANGIPRDVTLYNLSMENGDVEHTISGKAILHQDVPTEVILAIQWKGQAADLNQIKMRGYLYISGFSLAQWLKGREFGGWQVKDGMLSAKIWAYWNKGSFRKIQTTFQLYGLNLYSAHDKALHKINRLSGDVGWKRAGVNHIIAGDDILLDLPNHLWPVTHFYAELAPDAESKLQPRAVNVGYVNLQDVISYLDAFPPVLSADAKKTLSALKISGDIQSATLTFAGAAGDWKNTTLNAAFTRLNFLPWHSYPGIQQLSGGVKWDGKQGELTINSNSAEFRYDSVFLNPLMLEQLTGALKWHYNEKNELVLNAQSLQILNKDLAMNADGSLIIPQAGSPVIDLKANFALHRASHVTRYLPMKIFDGDLIEWLQEAFLSGAVTAGKAELRGALNDFPFEKGQGVFLISGQVNNLDFRFAPDWPRLQHVDADLVFSGRKMLVDVKRAALMDIPIGHVSGEIPYLGDEKPAILTVHADQVNADFQHALNFVHASPLEKTIGRMFSGVEMHGPMQLKLGLTVPLSDPGKTTISGDIAIKDTKMDLVPWNLAIAHLNGNVHFTESTTEAQKIEGQLFNKPLTFDLKSVRKDKKTSIVRATLTTTLSVTDLQSWLDLSFSQVVSGAANVDGEIDFAFNAPINVRLRSDLQGIAVNLPDQYAKAAHVSRPFAIDMTAQEKQPLRMQASYGDLLGAAVVLDRKGKNYKLSAVNLRLGKGMPALPSVDGLSITGDLGDLDWDKIKGYLDQAGEQKFSAIKLSNIDVRTKSLSVFGQRFTQVRLQAVPQAAKWNVTITSPEASGTIQAPVNFTNKGQITAQFQRLLLRTAVNGKQGALIDIKSLPAINFTADDVRYNNIHFGSVIFNAAPGSDGLNIRQLRISSALMDLRASGSWIRTGKGYLSQLQGDLTSSHVSDLLNSFGFDVHNFISTKGALNFDLSWRNAPFAPEAASLSGRASLDLGKGRIAEVSQASSGAKMDIGRLLSVFSLQTLPRRLMFDFSDVFQKGYSFDYLRGDFKFENGNAFTNNMHFDGPIARIDIVGRIGLARQNLDMTLGITPYVTSSIPVAAAILTGPVIGAAAFVANAVIGPQVSKVASYYYSVSGSWSDPAWKQVKAPRKR